VEDVESDSDDDGDDQGEGGGDSSGRTADTAAHLKMQAQALGSKAAVGEAEGLLAAGLVPEAVVVDCSVMSQLDSSALDALEQLPKDLKKRARDIRDARIKRLERWLQAMGDHQKAKGGLAMKTLAGGVGASAGGPGIGYGQNIASVGSVSSRGDLESGLGAKRSTLPIDATDEDRADALRLALETAEQSPAFRELLSIETSCGGAVSENRSRAMGEVTRRFLEAEMAWYRRRFGPLSIVEEAALLDIHDPTTDLRYKEDQDLLRARLVELGRVPLKIPRLYLACLRGNAQEMLRRNDEYVATVTRQQRRANRRTVWTCQWPCEITNPCEHACWEGCCVASETGDDGIAARVSARAGADEGGISGGIKEPEKRNAPI